MLFDKNSSVEAEVFWENKAKELDTLILGKTLGRVVQEDSKVPLWGLFYTTSDAVYFQTFKSNNWMTLMFSGNKNNNRTKDETIVIPKSRILRFEVQEPPRKPLQLFRKPPLVELTWNPAEEGKTCTLLFEMDGDAEAFVATLPC